MTDNHSRKDNPMTHPKPPYTRFGNRTDKGPYDRLEDTGYRYTCESPAHWVPPPQAAAHIKAERAEQRRLMLALAGLAVSLAVGFWTGAALERFWTEQNAAAVEGVK